jgi:hypothetical protein
LDRRFVVIGALTLLSASVSVIFTFGYFFFGWGGQYRYEFFYFPSPVTYTLDSLTSTGRMLSIALPTVAFLTLLLSAGGIRVPSPKMLSTEPGRPQRDVSGAPKFEHYPTGILAVSAAESRAASARLAVQASVRGDFLSRLFPYVAREGATRFGRIETGATVQSGEREPNEVLRGALHGSY